MQAAQWFQSKTVEGGNYNRTRKTQINDECWGSPVGFLCSDENSSVGFWPENTHTSESRVDTQRAGTIKCLQRRLYSCFQAQRGASTWINVTYLMVKVNKSLKLNSSECGCDSRYKCLLPLIYSVQIGTILEDNEVMFSCIVWVNVVSRSVSGRQPAAHTIMDPTWI